MTNTINKTIIAAGISLVALLGSCTKDFEHFNTDPNATQKVDPTALITTMELDAVYPTTGETTEPVNKYQTGWNLLADHYAGYMACANHFDGGNCPMVYNLSNAWRNTVFSVAFTQVMPAWLQLKAAYDQELVEAPVMAVGNILKVLTLHRASDMYGPLPVLHFGESSNPYDSQETLYNHFFETLDESIAILKDYTATTSDSRLLTKVDAVYGGDFNKWLKLANSLKLRLAMRIYYVSPSLSAKYAQEAIDAGVITSTEDGAMLSSYRQITVSNPMEMIWNSYDDARMGASMDSYLNGYEDPRRAAMFSEAQIDGGGWHGVRNGLGETQQAFYTKLSAPNITASTPMRWLLASEVAFLKAEHYYRQGDAAQARTCYEEGIRLSFAENGVSSAEADSYIANTTRRAAYFYDRSNKPNPDNTSACQSVSIAWANDGNELQRIITQKWIALYPNGMEAWAEFRRTGYPNIYPIISASADPTINKTTQIRRVIFPRSEYSNNEAEVNAAVTLLGGPDSGGTKLWWDKR